MHEAAPSFSRPPFVVVGRHGSRKSVRQCGPIQINAKRCRNLTVLAMRPESGDRYVVGYPRPRHRGSVESRAQKAHSAPPHGKQTAMTVARFPHLAHWGAFTALVEDGRVVGCEAFARDPAPSNMLDAIPEMVHSPLRIARPAIREGWREGKDRTGADRFREVSWEEALATVAWELARVRETCGP